MARRDNATAGNVGHMGIIAEDVAQQLTMIAHSTADEFRDKAEECRQQSHKAVTPRDEAVWLRIA